MWPYKWFTNDDLATKISKAPYSAISNIWYIKIKGNKIILIKKERSTLLRDKMLKNLRLEENSVLRKTNVNVLCSFNKMIIV